MVNLLAKRIPAGTYKAPASDPATGKPLMGSGGGRKFVDVAFTPDRMKRWADTANAMIAAGHSIPVPLVHDQLVGGKPIGPVRLGSLTAEERAALEKANAGFVKSVAADDGGIVFNIEPASPEYAEKLGTTIRKASPVIAGRFVDGDGTEWTDCVMHVMAGNMVQAQRQGNFEPVAAMAAADLLLAVMAPDDGDADEDEWLELDDDAADDESESETDGEGEGKTDTAASLAEAALADIGLPIICIGKTLDEVLQQLYAAATARKAALAELDAKATDAAPAEPAPEAPPADLKEASAGLAAADSAPRAKAAAKVVPALTMANALKAASVAGSKGAALGLELARRVAALRQAGCPPAALSRLNVSGGVVVSMGAVDAAPTVAVEPRLSATLEALESVAATGGYAAAAVPAKPADAAVSLAAADAAMVEAELPDHLKLDAGLTKDSPLPPAVAAVVQRAGNRFLPPITPTKR